DRGRMLVGFSIFVVGTLALVSVARGNPSPADGFDAVGRAGGAVGAAVGWGLARVVSPYGAAAIAAGLLAVGALVFTATPLAAVGRGIRRLFDVEPDEDEQAGTADARDRATSRGRRRERTVALEDVPLEV